MRVPRREELTKRDVGSRCPLEKWPVRSNFASRFMVDFARAGFSRLGHVSGLRQLGGLAEQILYVRPIHFAVLLAGAVRRFAARLVRPQALVVSGFSAVLAGIADSVDTGALPANLL